MISRKVLALVSLAVLIVGGNFLTWEPEALNSNGINNTNINKTVQAFYHSGVNTGNIKKDLPSGKNYIDASGRYNNKQDMKRQLRGREIRRVQGQNPVGIVEPIKRTPVNKNSGITDIALNTDSAVNDPGYKYEWAVTLTEANKSWALINQQRQIKVAVVDTGVDYTHNDLKNRVLTDLGYNFIDNNKNVMDDNGHGTHVSGIIAAEANNNEGITGIVGALDVKIIPIKVLDAQGEGEADVVAKGIKYAADNGADIINLSFGTEGESRDIESAIAYAKEKGVFIVVAAGNDNSDADLYTPAGDDKDVYTVSAISQQYKKASFSNYGTSIDAAAPGVKIISTVPNGYAVWDGTSMAAPIVSGISALVKAQNPNLTPDEIAEVLNSTTTDILTTGEDLQSGHGLVNAYKAVNKVKSNF